MLLRTTTNSDARKGIILIVVLALLTLFAIVGLSFVFYAQSEADASRIFREQSTLRSLDDSPDRLWSFALSKLIYDEADDYSGIYSGIRGHSLARSMYGNDDMYDQLTGNYLPNLVAFNGTGRLKVAAPLAGYTDDQFVNYTYFSTDGFLRDPERLDSNGSSRTDPTQARRLVTGGINVPYTYPDLNNMFLGAINANGQVLVQSFHRPWLFGPIDPLSQPTAASPNTATNPNWVSQAGKYLTLRPREIDMRTNPNVMCNFPYPEDAGGDVKNLWWLPGGNDSVWIDLNYPVQIGPDGRKFKPLFAFFITDLDNRINLNVHGNIRGQNRDHVSNTGWGRWEVNLKRCLNSANAPNEWQQLFTGIPIPFTGAANAVTVRGRYGWDGVQNDPTMPSNTAAQGTNPHVYGQVDFDGCQESAGFIPTQPVQLPGYNGYNPYNCFALFPAGYGNGQAAERQNHPLIYDYFKPFSEWPGGPFPGPAPFGDNPIAPDNRPYSDDRAFPASEMKELLNGGLRIDPNNPNPNPDNPFLSANPLQSYLGLLLPFNFSDPLDITGSLRRRSLVTTLSMDVERPGLMPWMWDGDNLGVASQIQAPRPDETDPVVSRAPWGYPSNFPNPTTTRSSTPVPVNSEFWVPNTPAANPATNWRAAIQSIKSTLGRLDLTRPLMPYPNAVRFDDGGPAQQQFLQAHQDRQNLARDIYRMLRKLCGVANVPPGDQAMPTETELMPRRWLAQLAVNIVDFIDSDDISTPFNFYPDNEPVNPPNDIYSGVNATNASGEGILRYWVFGVEMPRIVINEVFTEYNNPPTPGQQPPYTIPVNVWAELFCTMPQALNNPALDSTDINPIPLLVAPQLNTQSAYAPYRVVITNTNSALNGGPLFPRPLGGGSFDNDNVLGTPDQIRGQTDDVATNPNWIAFTGNYYIATNGQGNLTAAGPVNSGILPAQSFLVIGPGKNADGTGFSDKRQTIPTTLGATAGAQTLCIPTGAMTYNVNVALAGGWTPDDRPNGLTVLLRRLSNPRLPPNNAPGSAATGPNPLFNPYVTIDYMDGVNLSKNNYNNNQPNPGSYYWSYGKLQPYASNFNLVVPQGITQPNPIPNGGGSIHTLGRQNVWGQQATVINPYLPSGQPNPAFPPYDWLVQLDRQIASPTELLMVCGYHPHELTHRFIVPTAALPASGPLPAQWKHQHLAPWFDQTTRLYRLFEFVTVLDRAYGMANDNAYLIDAVNNRSYGVSSMGRKPGKININTVWDLEILMALFDPQPQPNGPNYFSAGDVQTIYTNLLRGRSPLYAAGTGTVGQNDRPFWGMGIGNVPGPTINIMTGTTTNNDQFYPNGTGINDTFLRVADMNQVPPNAPDPQNAPYSPVGPPPPNPPARGRPDLPRLFENPNAIVGGVYNPQLSHPALRFETLNKVFMNLTSRSNVFAVWCTVGYFEVVDDTARPVKLGAEIGKASGTNVRHRFFGIIDRTETVIAPRVLRSIVTPANNPGPGDVPNIPAGTQNPPGLAWFQIDPNSTNILSVTQQVPTDPTSFAITGATGASSSLSKPVQWTIQTGSVLVVDRGTSSEEWIVVTGVSQANAPPTPPAPPAPGVQPPTPIWIQANFLRSHSQGFGITIPGNPGPQPPIDVRDYQHAPVVPVSVAIN